MIRMLKDVIEVTVVVVILAFFLFILQVRNHERINDQVAIVEQLQGDVKAMTSAFKEIELELIRVQAAYVSWSREIEKLRGARDQVPEIPEIGRWRNRKEATVGIHDN